MMDGSLISLIVPFYNNAHLSKPFFESLLCQTYTNLQLIFINDGSTDRSEEVIFSYKAALEEKGYQFEYYYQDNKGLGGAINTGLKKVCGNYICWADPDDFFETDAFEVRIEYMQSHPECNVLTCDGFYIDEDKPSVKKRICSGMRTSERANQFELLLDYKSVFCAGCHMLRTKAFQKINPQMEIYEAKRGQNWQLLLPMYYAYDRHYLDVPVYNNVNYSVSMSHSDAGYEKKNCRICENETIQLETLKTMEMPEAEREKYFSHIKALHRKLKMYNARAFNRKDDFVLYMKQAAKAGEMDFKDWLRVGRYLTIGK